MERERVCGWGWGFYVGEFVLQGEVFFCSEFRVERKKCGEVVVGVGDGGRRSVEINLISDASETWPV